MAAYQCVCCLTPAANELSSAKTYRSSFACLALEPEEVDVFTFGASNHPRHYQCRRVNVTLCGRMEPIDVDLEALEVPEVCTINGVTLEPNVIAMMRDRNLAFADKTQGDQPQDSIISVVIGSDHYWRVVTGRAERSTDTLCAVEIIFG
ncbi:hypothetical protein MTO96_024680 [Rhipicephalus appendiculatus]